MARNGFKHNDVELYFCFVFYVSNTIRYTENRKSKPFQRIFNDIFETYVYGINSIITSILVYFEKFVSITN